MKKNLLLMALLCFLISKSNIAQVKKLNVGDTIPNFELEKILYHSTTSAKISDFKGKLIILDFWSTGCGGCILAMPKMGALQKEFKDKIKILPMLIAPDNYTDQWAQYADSFWRNNPYLKDTGLPMVINSSIHKYFDHPGVPYEVWIDGEGIIRGLTDGEHVTKEEISKILAGKFPNWKTYKRINRGYTKSLINVNPDHKENAKALYSAFLPYMEYTTLINNYRLDTETNHKRFIGINLSIFELYYMAYSREVVGMSDSRFMVQSKNKSKFYRDYFDEEWRAENGYCYEKLTPNTISDKAFFKQMAGELDNYLNIRSYIKTHNVKCFVLKVVDPILLEKRGISIVDNSYTLVNFVGDLTMDVTRHTIPIVFDPKLAKQYQNKHFNPLRIATDESMNIIKANALLKSRGLKLVESIQRMPMVVLEDLN